MPPKQKTKREEWLECMICNRIVHRLDLSSHQEMCKAGHPVVHGFIKEGILYANVCRPQIITDMPTFKEELVYIHPAAMTLCGLSIHHLCTVNSSYVFRAWPNASLHPVSVVLPETSKIQDYISCEGNLVTVQPFHDAGRTAEEVKLKIKTPNDIFLKDEFLQHLQLKMEGRYICQGGIYTVQYFGLSCRFCIKDVQVKLPAVYHAEVKVQQGNETFLCQDLSMLNISGASDTGDAFKMSAPSTPSQNSDLNSSANSMLSPQLYTPEKCFEKLECFQTPVTKRSGMGKKIELDKFVKVTDQTKFILSNCKSPALQMTTEKKVIFDSIGGLDKQIQAIREIFQVCLRRSDLEQYGDPTPRGILLFGPHGTGKTMLAKAIASEMSLFTVNVCGGTDVWSKFYGETEKKLKDIFDLAARRSPSLIVIDDLDRLCPPRDASHSDLEKRVVTTLLAQLDGLFDKVSREVCYVLGITSKPDSIDPALRRAGRLDFEIETTVPSGGERLQILKALLRDIPHDIAEADLKTVADAAHGFVGADLAAIIKKAKLCAVDRLSRTEGMTNLLMREDLLKAAKQVSPSAMREVQLEVPRVKWTDIGGQADIKLKLQQAVQWPLQHPESFTRLGISPPRGVLLYGPPGCSKTMIAKALATESGLNFLAVKGPELFNKWVGESERAVREVFRKARAAAPSIIFFDEIDALAVERGSGGSNVADRVLTQLLTEIDGIERLQGVTVVAATNRPDKIDKALLRPGRIDRVLYVPLPDSSTRREILEISLRKMPLVGDFVLEELVNRTEQYSGAELTAVCNEAALSALEEDMNCEKVALRHFNAALTSVKPGINAEMLNFYENYSKKCGLHFV